MHATSSRVVGLGTTCMLHVHVSLDWNNMHSTRSRVVGLGQHACYTFTCGWIRDNMHATRHVWLE